MQGKSYLKKYIFFRTFFRTIFLSRELLFGGATQIRTGDQSFADSCLTTWLWHQVLQPQDFYGAGNGNRTRTLALARLYSTVKLYLHVTIKLYLILCSKKIKPLPWQGCTLPTELLSHVFVMKYLYVSLYLLLYISFT